jgi:hypothetical protein
MVELIIVSVFMLVVIWIVVHTAFKSKPTTNHYGETHYHYYGNEKEEEKPKLKDGELLLQLLDRVNELQSGIRYNEIKDKDRDTRRLKK